MKPALPDLTCKASVVLVSSCMHIRHGRGPLLWSRSAPHYSEPLAICPIVDGRVELTTVHALQGKGLNYKCPLGIASGAVPACKAS